MNTRIFAALVVVASLSVTATSSFASSPNGGFGGNAWLYPGYWYNVYGMESIPYFSLHPPVYYSRPVARTYGYSPFAYPPGTMTPDFEPVQPQVVHNPHVPQPASAVQNRFAGVQPLRIRNPYVDDGVQLSHSD